MTDAHSEARFDHQRDLRKHDGPRPHDRLPPRPTNEQIRAELDRLEADLLDAAARSQTACKEAMNIIEKLMADLGVPMSKGQANV